LLIKQIKLRGCGARRSTADRGQHRQAAGAALQSLVVVGQLARATPSIWISSLQPLRWMRPRWRPVLRIWLTKAAEPARGIHALLKCCKAAICAATRPTAVNRAPRIVLGLGARHYPGSHDENCQHKKQDSHDQSPAVRRPQAQTPKPRHYFTADTESSPLGCLRPSRRHRLRWPRLIISAL
jgi:hypothetical protein